MGKTFRAWDVDQAWLLPPWVHEFVPAGHLAYFVRDTVRAGVGGEGPALRSRSRRSGPLLGHTHAGGERRRKDKPLLAAMAQKLRRARSRSRYRLRKQVVEPVFGQIKQARGFRQLLLRGLHKVRAEWALLCTAHNLLKLLKLARAGSAA
jgi:hypothetical protein